jgi:nucleotidyltransferase substrate binding protein (TIGR01987 family)
MSGAEKNPDARWRQRFHSFRKAFGQLISAVEITRQRELSELERQGLIQAFEFNHELAWKTLKDYLEDRGEVGIHGSKDATRKAFSVGLLDDGDVWMEMIQSRNRSSHTYHEKTAAEIAGQIAGPYFLQFQKFEARFLKLEDSSS